MYDIDNHSETIYKIVSALSKQRGTILLNFANDDHYRCISGMFGGEEYFKKNFPAHYQLAQKTRQAHESINVSDEPDHRGFENYTEVEDLFYIESDKQLYSCGYLNLTERAAAIYQTLFVYRNGALIDRNSLFTYDQNYASIDLTVNNIEKSGDHADDLFIVIHSSWKPTGRDVFLSAISYEARNSLDSTLEEVVKNISVNDPGHINTSPDMDIMVAYGRTPSSRESIDYPYPEVRVEQQQKIFLANSGTVELQDNVRFIQGDVLNTSIVLNHEVLGTIWYSKQIPDIAISKKDDTHFTWNIDKDWDQVIPGSIIAGTRIYAYDMHLSFYAQRPDDTQPKRFYINVCSYQKSPNPHYRQISNIKLLWGCLAEDTQVKMADGSMKPVQTIVIGDRVMGLEGKSQTVTNVWIGTEEKILRITTTNGNEIMATEKHPFMTREGMKPILYLAIGDELLMENGDYFAIEQCYPVVYGRNVYNLDIDGGGAFICNGFVTGDNMLQNSYRIPVNEAATHPAILEEAERLRVVYNQKKDER